MSNSFRHPGAATGGFLPRDYVKGKIETRANLFTLTLFMLVMAATVGTFIVTVEHRSEIRKRAEAMDVMYREEAAKIDELKQLESQRAQMMEKAEITAALIEKVPRWALLAEVTMRMPSNMRLDTFALKSKRLDKVADAGAAKAEPRGKAKSLTEKAKTKTAKKKDEPADRPKVQPPRFEYALTLSGTAHENNEIADYLAQLKQVPMLDKVELAFIRESKEGGGKTGQAEEILRRFEIGAVIKSSVDAEALGASLRQVVAKRTSEMLGRDSATADTESAAKGRE
ncbi:MAG: PilN domain-containing protein [Phycisphaerales bacterium]